MTGVLLAILAVLGLVALGVLAALIFMRQITNRLNHLIDLANFSVYGSDVFSKEDE